MKVVFDGLTPKQAKTLAEWFSGQGEQDCVVWFDCKGIPSPTTKSIKEKDGNIVVLCQTVE